MQLIIQCIAIALIVFLWLRTNVVIDYFGFLFRKRNIFYVRDYEASFLHEHVEYPLFLASTYPNFLTKLISCPLCLSLWTNLLFFDGILNWLFKGYLTLLAFVLLDKVYKK